MDARVASQGGGLLILRDTTVGLGAGLGARRASAARGIADGDRRASPSARARRLSLSAVRSRLISMHLSRSRARRPRLLLTVEESQKRLEQPTARVGAAGGFGNPMHARVLKWQRSGQRTRARVTRGHAVLHYTQYHTVSRVPLNEDCRLTYCKHGQHSFARAGVMRRLPGSAGVYGVVGHTV